MASVTIKKNLRAILITLYNYNNIALVTRYGTVNNLVIITHFTSVLLDSRLGNRWSSGEERGIFEPGAMLKTLK